MKKIAMLTGVLICLSSVGFAQKKQNTTKAKASIENAKAKPTSKQKFMDEKNGKKAEIEKKEKAEAKKNPFAMETTND